jgi:hypothetical protein
MLHRHHIEKGQSLVAPQKGRKMGVSRRTSNTPRHEVSRRRRAACRFWASFFHLEYPPTTKTVFFQFLVSLCWQLRACIGGGELIYTRCGSDCVKRAGRSTSGRQTTLSHRRTAPNCQRAPPSAHACRE